MADNEASNVADNQALCRYCGHAIRKDAPQPWRDYGIWYHIHDSRRQCSAKVATPETMDPVDGDEIDELVNWQLSNRT